MLAGAVYSRGLVRDAMCAARAFVHRVLLVVVGDFAAGKLETGKEVSIKVKEKKEKDTHIQPGKMLPGGITHSSEFS